MLNQQTLAGQARFSGIGLHSGNKVNLAFLPAPPNTGIRFRRVDLDGQPEIEAVVENVSDTNRSTTLSKGNVKLHTVEHVLAAFAGAGIDNAIVELDASEPPIADGSSLQYSQMIEEAGIAAQDEPREIYQLEAPIELQNGDTHMTAFPHDRLKVTCTSAGENGRFTQLFSAEISPETWRNDISSARTFCYYEEIEHLYKNGLIKGGSLENAIVIRDDAVLTNEPLRYPDEFVRHKILDIIGDLSLIGQPIGAHIVAVCPSHSANCEMARRIVAQKNRRAQVARTFAPPAEKVQQPKVAVEPGAAESIVLDGAQLDVNQIMKVLPHRYPFLMVDRVISIDGNHIVAQKNVSVNEPYFEGHFPDHPVMPGVMQLEAIAQVAGILMLKKAENFGKLAYFMAAEKVKWRKPVLPGDILTIDVELTKSRGKIGKAIGKCLVNGEEVSGALITFMLVDSDA
ncbi:MAG: bifunctional UDP-3-O-[3-hydroxymyristoyl] N-acetylglucosamine deacetylase/3-hydroxyacyl-ACP dehydratase [Pedosphaera sp.]|nr:bifunctional UDP-3-O-[3-hydroxymyristoyl] N-acetylglucosamine deacetylase/3-hydroxyacyl-ACP dehydratase [Pedosphaera sp.]